MESPTFIKKENKTTAVALVACIGTNGFVALIINPMHQLCGIDH